MFFVGRENTFYSIQKYLKKFLKVFEEVCDRAARKENNFNSIKKYLKKVFKSISKGVRHDSQKIKDLLQYLKGVFKNKSVHTVQRIKCFRRQRKHL